MSTKSNAAVTPSSAGGSKLSARSTNSPVPGDKVRLDVLLITGQRRFLDFEPQTTVKDVRERIWADWPQDWPTRPHSLSAIRILHLGHILEDKFVLAPPDAASTSRTLPVGKSTVVHLLVRQLPTSNDDGDEESLKKKKPRASGDTPGCCCVIC